MWCVARVTCLVIIIDCSEYLLEVAQSLNKKLQVDMIILDFSKAFDTEPHNILLNKLDTYRIRNKTHTWISNFLKYRKERVVIGGEHSTWIQVMSQVYIKAQYSARYCFSLILMICLFADDCVLYREIKMRLIHKNCKKT